MTTTKPAQRREPILPWLSNSQIEQTSSKSEEWETIAKHEDQQQISSKAIVPELDEPKPWTLWPKPSPSEIEQRKAFKHETLARDSRNNHISGLDLLLRTSEQKNFNNFHYQDKDGFYDDTEAEKFIKKTPKTGNQLLVDLEIDRDRYEGVPKDTKVLFYVSNVISNSGINHFSHT